MITIEVSENTASLPRNGERGLKPGGIGKVLVRMNYRDKVKQAGKRTRLTLNFVRTGGLVDETAIKSGSQYIELEK